VSPLIASPLGEEPEPAPRARRRPPRLLPADWEAAPPRSELSARALARVPESAQQLPVYRQAFAVRRAMAQHVASAPHALPPSPSDHYAGMAVDLNWRDDPGPLAQAAGLAWEETLQQVAALFNATAPAVSSFLASLRELEQELGYPGDQRPPLALRESDPRAYALEARRRRNTGPARPSGQGAKRPRRHR